MITIFRGRKLSLRGAEDVIYAEVAVALRDQIHYFNTGKSCNPFAVFMKIALHTDEYGWAFPGKAEISRKTGVTSKDAIASLRSDIWQICGSKGTVFCRSGASARPMAVSGGLSTASSRMPGAMAWHTSPSRSTRKA